MFFTAGGDGGAVVWSAQTATGVLGAQQLLTCVMVIFDECDKRCGALSSSRCASATVAVTWMGGAG